MSNDDEGNDGEDAGKGSSEGGALQKSRFSRKQVVPEGGDGDAKRGGTGRRMSRLGVSFGGRRSGGGGASADGLSTDGTQAGDQANNGGADEDDPLDGEEGSWEAIRKKVRERAKQKEEERAA